MGTIEYFSTSWHVYMWLGYSQWPLLACQTCVVFRSKNNNGLRIHTFIFSACWRFQAWSRPHFLPSALYLKLISRSVPPWCLLVFQLRTLLSSSSAISLLCLALGWHIGKETSRTARISMSQNKPGRLLPWNNCHCCLITSQLAKTEV